MTNATEHIQRYEQWPHMAHVDNAKTTGIQFESTIATVASVHRGTNGKWSCKFREDTKGGRYGWELYEGEPETSIAAGDQVEVGLSVKNKDKGGYFYNVNFIRPVASGAAQNAAPAPVNWPEPDDQADPAPQPTEPAAAPFDPDAAKRVSIEKQSFYDHFNPDAVMMLGPERQAAMLEAYYATGMELVSGPARSVATQAVQDLLESAS